MSTYETNTAAAGDYFVVDSPYEVANWRPLVHWLLYIPHYLIVYALQIVARVVFVVYWFMFVFTGTLHRGMYDMMTMYERYSARATGYLLGYSELYPPFDFGSGPHDNNAYAPMRLELPEVPGAVQRSAAFNWILAIPHYIVLAVYAIGAVAVAIVGWVAVLFTGAWPPAMRDFLVRVSNYYYRIWAYVVMVQNEYPKFALP